MKSTAYHNIFKVLLILLPVILLLSCRKQTASEKAPEMTAEEQKEMLLRVNKFLVQKDVELIESYSIRRGWNMEVSETGLFYEIYEPGQGKKVEQGDIINLKYELSLLDGTLCYSSEEDGNKIFRLGKSQEISGLEQGVALMRAGEKARFIIPPHLAYGLLGDDNRIPARSIIIYQVELVEVKSLN
jgi:FKBP-type peptidyl-prolyl cis-trans isomerase FkpA